jgi:nickel/cobalt exporter
MLSTKYSEVVLHNWLGLVSAGLVTLVGAWMLWQRLVGNGHGHVHLFGSEHHHHEQEAEHSHEHLHPHVHPHVHEHGEGHDHHPHVHPQPTQPPARKGMIELLLLGISGGIIPCPAAIAILLAGVASGKLAEGLTMTLLFSLGLGGVMMGIGLLLSQSTHLTNRISQNLDIARKIGIASAALILVIGCYTMFHSIRGILS